MSVIVFELDTYDYEDLANYNIFKYLIGIINKFNKLLNKHQDEKFKRIQ